MSYRRRRTPLWVAAVVVAWALSGCSSQPIVADLTLDEAKAGLFDLETELLDVVPAPLVVERIDDAGTVEVRLARCGDGLSYPSVAELRMVPNDQMSVFLRKAEEIVLALPGDWVAVGSEGESDTIHYLNRTTGMSILVSIFKSRLLISAHSACFPEFEGYSPHKTY